MNSLLAPSKISSRLFPCPQCGTSNPFHVVTSIDSEEELALFICELQNRALCCSCGWLIEAPIRLRVCLPNPELPAFEYIPFEQLADPEVMDDILQSKGRCHRVHSLDELERSIWANVRISIQRLTRRQARRRESPRLARQHSAISDAAPPSSSCHP